MFTRSTLQLCALCFVFLYPTCVEAGDSQIGRKISSFTLDNCYGRPVSLNEFSGKKAIVIAFLGTECPLAKLYGPRLDELEQTLGAKGLAVIGINSNKQDSLKELSSFVNQQKLRFPMLKDPGNQVADAFSAKRTPEVFLLDKDFIVRYHGRVDDQYAVGIARDEPQRSDLAEAISQLLAGQKVSVPETDVVGCHIGRVKEVQPTGQITYNKHISPIFNDRCMRCHRNGEIAPFNLTNYDDVLGWEDTILEVIDEGRMPPWFANPKHGEFANDARLSEEQKDLICSWIENGMPEGDPDDLPPTPQFTAGWRIVEPDQIISMPKAFSVPAEGIVDYQHFVVDPGWTEDKYIVAVEARPQNPRVVHHILLYIIPPGKTYENSRRILAGHAPGAPPLITPNGVAIKVLAGSRLVFQMHYTPNGYDQTDQSYAGICFAKDPAKIKRELRGDAPAADGRGDNDKLVIKPNENDQKFECYSRSIRKDVILLSMTPHMHLRGKSFKYELLNSNAEVVETLLDVPAYDFNWQLKYVLKKPKLLRAGQRIKCTAVYDNSKNNLANPDPNKAVRWGRQSFNEMMIGFMDYIPL
jgi:peroxiredoxin